MNKITSKDLAEKLNVKIRTVYHRFYIYGHVYGFKPVEKLKVKGGSYLWGKK